MLSTAYEIDGEYRGKSVTDLKIAADVIRAGKQYEFDIDEVNDVVAYVQQVLAIPGRRLLLDLLRWIGPPLNYSHDGLFFYAGEKIAHLEPKELTFLC